MAANAENESDDFVVVVLGSTGVGKSKLAIEIAEKIGGEIISADSMQIYKGLDIITNKVTAEEQALIPHHMINVVEPRQQFTVVQFRDMSLALIKDMQKRKKVPIIVGGTNYYIEALLWRNLIDSETKKTDSEENNILGSTMQDVLCLESKNEICAKNANELDKSCSVISTGSCASDANKEIGARSCANDANKEIGARSCANDANKEIGAQSCANDANKEIGAQSCANNANREIGAQSCANDANREIDAQSCANDANEEIGTRSCANDANEEICAQRCSNNANVPFTESDAQSFADNANYANENSSLYEKLTLVDPVMALRHHPNDKRKIARSLQVFEQSGIRHSQLLAQQHSEQGASDHGGPLRFKNACVLWLRCDLDILDRRLDTRVDKMVDEGLVSEMLDFHKNWQNSEKSAIDKNTHGIFQSIGFKEFAAFLASEEVDKNGELFRECVELMKAATRRYARKQIKWVKNRFLGRPKDCTPDVYALDASDLTKWDSVLDMALSIVGRVKDSQACAVSPLERIDANMAGKRAYHNCDICDNRVIIGDQNWSAHLKSKSHRHHKRNHQKQT